MEQAVRKSTAIKKEKDTLKEEAMDTLMSIIVLIITLVITIFVLNLFPIEKPSTIDNTQSYKVTDVRQLPSKNDGIITDINVTISRKDNEEVSVRIDEQFSRHPFRNFLKIVCESFIGILTFILISIPVNLILSRIVKGRWGFWKIFY